MGPELFSSPQGSNLISSSILKFSGMGDMGIKESSDSNLDHLKKSSIPTFMGMFPSGTSFRCVNHYR